MKLISFIKTLTVLALSVFALPFGPVSASKSIPNEVFISNEDNVETTCKLLAEEIYYIDSLGNMYSASSENLVPNVDITDLFTAQFYYTGVNNSGYKSYKVSYTLTSLEKGRYYTSSTFYVKPKNSTTTHSKTSKWNASLKKASISGSISYHYTSNPPSVAAVTISCKYVTTTGKGTILAHKLSSPIDIS